MVSTFLIEAPFAVFRTFSAGWYRPSATFITPSAAYGLLMNAACIETRVREEDEDHDGKTPASLTREGLPELRIAVGIPTTDTGDTPFPISQTVFQQLHNYPVSTKAGMPKEMAKGNKNHITPVRRSLLSEFRAIVAVDAEGNIVDRINRGLNGGFNGERYGLPFMGDNQFLLDRFEEVHSMPAIWFSRITADSESKMQPRATRLTTWIDRADTSKTQSSLYAPSSGPTIEIPSGAWTTVGMPR